MTTPLVPRLVIVSSPGYANVYLPLGDGPVRYGGVQGGWESVARPKRQAFSHWVGHDLAWMTVPFMFDGYDTDRSVEGFCFALEVLAARAPGAPHPPVLTLAGPVPYANLRWVIQPEIAWGDAIRSEVHGKRVRQPGVLQLMQYVEADLVVTVPAAQSPADAAAAGLADVGPAQPASDTHLHGAATHTHDNGDTPHRHSASDPAYAGFTGAYGYPTPPAPAGAPRSHTVASGETLWGIAVTYYSDGSKWTIIADANNIRDPRSLTVGQVLTIP